MMSSLVVMQAMVTLRSTTGLMISTMARSTAIGTCAQRYTITSSPMRLGL